MNFFGYCRSEQRGPGSVDESPHRLKPMGVRGLIGVDKAMPYRMLQSILFLSVALVALPGLSGCGYHQAASMVRSAPNVRTLAVPVFQSKVQGFRTETEFTQAVVRELNTRTRYKVLTSNGDGTFEGSGAGADATLRGTILTETIAPLTYDASSGQTSSYLVSVTAQVVMTSHDGAVLYRNDAFAWREQFQSTQDLNGSVQEDSAAVRRAAHDFGQALVSDMLESFQ